MSTQQKFWNDIGPTSDDMETLKPFLPTPDANCGMRGTATNTGTRRPSGAWRQVNLNDAVQAVTLGAPTSSLAVSRAKTFLVQALELVSTAHEAVYSLSSFAWLENCGQAPSSWKTYQRCLVEEWIPYSQALPKSGLMRNGIVYHVPPLVRRMSGTGCSLWATPQARDHFPPHTAERIAAKKAEGHGMRNLNDEVAMESTNGKTGQLSAEWVTWLMGFPPGWTDTGT